MGSLYEQDFICWTEQQARLLRELAGTSNAPVDGEHLAEAIEDLGRSELHELASQVRRVVLHLLKLEVSPAIESRRGWIESVEDARAEIRSRLRRDPGLRPRLQAILLEEAADAAAVAERVLRGYGEDSAGIAARQRTGSVYTEAQILGDWFPATPAA